MFLPFDSPRCDVNFPCDELHIIAHGFFKQSCIGPSITTSSTGTRSTGHASEGLERVHTTTPLCKTHSDISNNIIALDFPST